MLYVVHFVLGLAWWYLVLLGTGLMISAASFQTITNLIIRSAYSWIFPEDILKNIVGIPL